MLDPKKTNDLLNKMMLIARDDRARLPYSKEEGFVPKIVFIGPNDESIVAPITWRDEREKYAKMEAAAHAAKETFSQAIMLVSDTRWVKFAEFNEYFKVEPPTAPINDKSIKEYQDRYYAVLRKHDGQVKNLPRQLWSEAVMVAIKGPRCGTHSLMAPYTQGPGDKVQYLPRESNPMDREEVKVHMNLIPEWWQ